MEGTCIWPILGGTLVLVEGGGGKQGGSAGSVRPVSGVLCCAGVWCTMWCAVWCIMWCAVWCIMWCAVLCWRVVYNFVCCGELSGVVYNVVCCGGLWCVVVGYGVLCIKWCAVVWYGVI